MITNQSVITNDGGLSIALNCKDVTWFRFLQASRATNSIKGGWNSRTYWRKRGLEVLVKGAFLETWTKNSLETRVHPLPRRRDFHLHRPEEELRLREGAVGENGLNYSLFSTWRIAPRDPLGCLGMWSSLSYEVPLGSEREDQLKVDLLGYREGAIGIIELKQAGNRTDSPLMALTEAICYGLQAIRCEESLMGEYSTQLGQNCAFENLELKIVAPNAYWRHWHGEGEDGHGQSDREMLGQIVCRINKSSVLARHSFSVSYGSTEQGEAPHWVTSAAVAN
jgi:hypothetical protein